MKKADLVKLTPISGYFISQQFSGNFWQLKQPSQKVSILVCKIFICRSLTSIRAILFVQCTEVGLNGANRYSTMEIPLKHRSKGNCSLRLRNRQSFEIVRHKHNVCLLILFKVFIFNKKDKRNCQICITTDIHYMPSVENIVT